MLLRTVIGLIIIVLLIPAHAGAIVNPLETPNNRFGIHIVDEHDLVDAANLVNGNGGAGGYIAMVITEDDRDPDKWQRTFDRMRELRLIPMIRLATRPAGDHWEKPSTDDAKGWADFLDGLNWVTQNRYVILFNEPNHAKEWGNDLNPEEYAAVAHSFITELKEHSDDFFILPAGFDQAANNTLDTMSLDRYFQRMYEADKEVVARVDGWTSHSYPNPHFSGSIQAQGRQSIRGYEWELAVLESRGMRKDIPVFITETGWAHAEGVAYNPRYQSAEEVTEKYETAFSSVWDDPRIVMVAPFILNYQSPPFDHFSWKKLGTDEYYPVYERILGISKVRGLPTQYDSATLSTEHIPPTLVTNGRYHLPVVVRNTGQSIWGQDSGWKLIVSGSSMPRHTFAVPSLKPNEHAVIPLSFTAPDAEGAIPLVLGLIKNGDPIDNPSTVLLTIKRPANVWSRLRTVIKQIG